jgi:hypothetical protein
MAGDAWRKAMCVRKITQTDDSAELSIGNPVDHLGYSRHLSTVEQTVNDSPASSETFEKSCSKKVRISGGERKVFSHVN